jgi:DivIVA domain-containing protein
MPPVELDRQAIERRDFPIGRRGYDRAAVDAHLRTLAAEFEELQRAAAGGRADLSLASTAGTQVKTILEAAEQAAAEIERTAQESARQLRDAANQEAERTRDDALQKARAHVAAVAQVAATLLERVGSMDSEVNALISSLRSGAGRLAADLTAVEAGMGEMYGAASGRSAAAEPQPSSATPAATSPPEASESAPDAAMAAPVAAQAQAQPPARPAGEPVVETPPEGGGDVDGARLIALNMALNGESRSDTERYLAENFQLQDRLKLVDEVYAAIEG